MQRFMAELSSPVDKAEFERSWHRDPTLSHEPSVEFVFLERPFRVSCIQILPDSGHRPVSMKALTPRYGGSIAAATSVASSHQESQM